MEDFKDKCDNIIPIYEFPNKMEITYILTNNIIYNTTNKINYNSNILEYTSQDIIKISEDLEQHFVYGHKNISRLNNKTFITIINAMTFPACTLFYMHYVYEVQVFNNSTYSFMNLNIMLCRILLYDYFNNSVNEFDEIQINFTRIKINNKIND